MKPIILTHGGTGSPAEWSDGCARASRAGRKVLRDGGNALDAAIAAVRVMEDDGRFNAGRGAVLRLDGLTIEADAGLMASDGRIGAVAALRGFAHPVSVAREVMDSPHTLFAGEGAARFATLRGAETSPGEPAPENLERHRRVLDLLRDRASKRPAWRDADFSRLWNFPREMPEELRPRDTVGAVVRDKDGLFAAANSTGGAVPMLLGRVGDSPLPGAGFWAGPAGAVATTGVGEEIVRRLAAKAAYDRLEAGLDPNGALAEVVSLFPPEISFGAIAVTPDDCGVGANRNMAWSANR